MLVTNALGMAWWQISGDPVSMRLEGDWVVRAEATPRQRAEALAEVVAAQTGVPVSVEARTVVKPVVVMKGVARGGPGVSEPPAGGVKTVYVYAGSRVPHDTSLGMGHAAGMDTQAVSRHLQVPFIIEQPSDDWIQWKIDRDLLSGPLDAQTLRRVVENLERQTGFDLEIEQRELTVWHLARS